MLHRSEARWETGPSRGVAAKRLVEGDLEHGPDDEGTARAQAEQSQLPYLERQPPQDQAQNGGCGTYQQTCIKKQVD